MLLLNINRKSYMGSPMALLHLTLSDLETSNSMSPKFQVKVKITHRLQSLISRKRAELGNKLLLTINRKPYMVSVMAPLDLA